MFQQTFKRLLFSAQGKASSVGPYVAFTACHLEHHCLFNYYSGARQVLADWQVGVCVWKLNLKKKKSK